MSVSIIGYGVVGRSVHALFPEAVIHDPAQGFDDWPGVLASDFAFVCVPTPRRADGACDLSILDAVFDDLEGYRGIAVIRSTVPPGTTDRQTTPAVFQPEFIGVTPGHPFGDDRDVPWIVLGGWEAFTAEVAELYKAVVRPDTKILRTDAVTAELVKYATNAFLAVKVEFCNELADIARRLRVDYDELRELWLQDPRIGRSHTMVSERRGFGGACLPKDLDALIAVAQGHDLYPDVLVATAEANRARVSPREAAA